MNRESRIKNHSNGFITYIILIVIALVALKYAFHFDIVEYWKSAQVQGYVSTLKSWVQAIYNWVDTLVGTWVGKK